MAHPSREDERHLSTEQLELVAKTRHPGMRELGDDEFKTVHESLRKHRDDSQKNTDDADKSVERSHGGRRRAQILNQAVKRASNERSRRDRHLARSDLRSFAADVTGKTVDKSAPKRGTAKGFKKAAARTEKGENVSKG